MKNLVKWFGIVALVAIIGLSFAACGDDGGEPAGSTEPPETAMYSGIAEDGSKYTLKVIEKTGRYAAQDGDSYILYLVKDGITQTSSGTVTTSGNLLTLKPTSITITFTIKIDETGITEISGTITFEDRTEAPAPGPIEPLPELPENWPYAERWGKYRDIVNEPPNTATLDYKVDNKTGVCTITVGGKAVPPLNDEGGTDGYVKYWNSCWRATATFAYTIVAGNSYTYTFEAWTDGPERALHVQWYWEEGLNHQATGWDVEGDWEKNLCPPTFKITSERKTYTLTSDGPLPKSTPSSVDFQCANQLGTFYVKMLSIDSF
jgi:hypothetical protein